jgi:hypothetical protein
LLIQTFVSELSIETLDVAVLHGPARLNQNVANTVQSGPSQECSACEFWPVICSNCNWVASKYCRACAATNSTQGQRCLEHGLCV